MDEFTILTSGTKLDEAADFVDRIMDDHAGQIAIYYRHAETGEYMQFDTGYVDREGLHAIAQHYEIVPGGPYC